MHLHGSRFVGSLSSLDPLTNPANPVAFVGVLLDYIGTVVSAKTVP